MKRKCMYIVSMVIFMMALGLFFLPNNASASPPSATLTVDGTLVGTYSSVQEAVDAIETAAGQKCIVEIAEGTVSDPLDIKQFDGKHIVIKPQAGATVTFTNTITIDGLGDISGPETLLVQGLNFDFTAGSPAECINLDFVEARPGHCYPHNVTINGCTFKGVFNQVVAVQSVPGGMRNIAIMNCTATDMHSLAQLKAVSGFAFIQNCTLSNADGGVNFYGPGDLIVDSCKFSVVGYAVRSGQGAGSISSLGSVDINNSVLNSNSSEDGTIVLRGDSTSNINIIHSILTNANSDGPSIQNLNAASESLYDIDIVESDVTGQITGINLGTITTIDDPNVQNGPVDVVDHHQIEEMILPIFKIMLTIIIIVLIYDLIRWLFPCFSRPF